MCVLLPSCDTGCHCPEWPAQATLVRQYRCSASPLFRQGSPWEHCNGASTQRDLQLISVCAWPPSPPPPPPCRRAVGSGQQWTSGDCFGAGVGADNDGGTTEFGDSGCAVSLLLQKAGTSPRPCLSDENLLVGDDRLPIVRPQSILSHH